MAQVIPAARPFVTSLYAALTAAKADAASAAIPTRGRNVATRRFCTAARWMRTLITAGEDAILPLKRIVNAVGKPEASASGWFIQFDASTTGGGAVLRTRCAIAKFFYLKWSEDMVKGMGVRIRDPKYQTFWEIPDSPLGLNGLGQQFYKAERGRGRR